MRLRWEGTGEVFRYWPFSWTLYFLLLGIFVASKAGNIVADFCVLVTQLLVGLTGTAATFSFCRPKGAPTLREVFQVKLDENFQKKVEGRKKYDKRNDKKALTALLRVVTCGIYRPKTNPAAAEAPAPAAAPPAKPPTSTRVTVFTYCVLVEIVFGVMIKLTGLMWFLIRALVALPLYGLVPRLYFMEWVIHFHQKKIISSLDFAAWRPTMPAFAPFFFHVYLPKMGMDLGLPELPFARLPDVDLPDVTWPQLPSPVIKLPDLRLLLEARFPGLSWPELPDIELQGFSLPSMNFCDLIGQLKVKLPGVGALQAESELELAAD